jgi:predicted  nucleic acid-binding Zn-ribbon protein
MSKKALVYQLPNLDSNDKEASSEHYATFPERSIPQTTSTERDDAYEEVKADLGSTVTNIDDDVFTNVGQDITVPLCSQKLAASHFQDQTYLMQNQAVSNKASARPYLFKRPMILILVAFLAFFVLISAGALALGILDFTKTADVQDMALQTRNETQCGCNHEALAERVKNMEVLLSQLLDTIDQQNASIRELYINTSADIDDINSRINASDAFFSTQFATTSAEIANVSLKLNASIDLIDSQLTNLNDRGNSHSVKLNSTSALLTSLTERLDTSVESINSQLSTTSSDYARLDAKGNATNTLLEVTASVVNSLNLSLSARIESIGTQLTTVSSSLTKLAMRENTLNELYNSSFTNLSSRVDSDVETLTTQLVMTSTN